MMKNSTLCYMERDGKYLMMHRTVKENDVNKDKWIGVGGRFEERESPEDCLFREVREETGVSLNSWSFRGIVTFIYKDMTELMYLYTADGWDGDIDYDCDEGVLEWVGKNSVDALDIWEGDRIFFRLFDEGSDFFSLKLVYSDDDNLVEVNLNGEVCEWRK